MRNAQDVLDEAVRAYQAGNLAHAELLLCNLIQHDDDNPQLHFALGNLYIQAGAYGRALTFLRQAVALAPESNGAMENLASVYRLLGKTDKSREWNTRSLAIARTAHVLSNLAGTYINEGNPQQALAFAEQALELAPDFPEAGNHRALALLEMGRFEEGWAQYDSRLDVGHKVIEGRASATKFHRRPYTVPMWTGQPTKLLAIHGEQGLGDEIMFLTCLSQLRLRYNIDDAVIECSPRLVKLLARSTGLRCYGTHAELVAAEKPDYYIPMGSLPRFVWPVTPNAYLEPTVEYPGSRQFRIGLSWFGGKLATHVNLRNAPVREWKTLLTEDARYISLQYGDVVDEAAELGIPHDAESIADLDRLAAMIRSCDLVVSVCNTTVHMAGALGVPCLALVPSKPAWRYGLTGDKMVWYDSVTMLRQMPDEPWSDVLTRARDWIADYRGLPRTEQAVA